MIGTFDETRLDDPQVLAVYDEQLRHLASFGARIRIEAADAQPSDRLDAQPRGVVVVGAEARLLRAVLEPVCPVPLVAWPLPGLPGWVGPLDLVVVLASEPASQGDPALLATTIEATRRGCMVLAATPASSQIAQSSHAIVVPTRTADPTAAAIVVLSLLHQVGLGPEVIPDHAAEAADMVAEESSPHRDLSTNPAKDLACGLGDAQPLIWGGSVLAARASRRIAAGIRFYSGHPVLAADAREIAQVLQHVSPKDPFADPFTDGEQRSTVLVLLDDELTSPAAAADDRLLRELAEQRGVRICELNAGVGSEIDRYVTLLLRGLYGANYLAVATGAEPALMR
ncbi:MAG: SIS domain-containing protein [Brooklawnia sp.]|uniref:SIS domain-containing protein n=1 Tax=Brooklawnia sp. TaxID=2699740 RepID=UPI003C72F00B